MDARFRLCTGPIGPDSGIIPYISGALRSIWRVVKSEMTYTIACRMKGRITVRATTGIKFCVASGKRMRNANSASRASKRMVNGIWGTKR